MKLSQITDKEIDQNEIESKYFWNIHGNKAAHRVNLAERAIDLSKKSLLSMKNYLTIDDNKIFGLMFSTPNYPQQLFILDEYFNIKIIETYPIQSSIRHNLFSCFYGDSIFTFEAENDPIQRGIRNHVKRYLIREDRWINLVSNTFDILQCIGFDQKIIMTSTYHRKMMIYDIILNSYAEHPPIKTYFESMYQMMVKNSGNLYWITHKGDHSCVYSCDDPLSEWTFVCYCDQSCYQLIKSNNTCYNGSIYYFKEPKYYEFSLSEFSTKEVKVAKYKTFLKLKKKQEIN